jgi:hypothetical protein
LSESCFSANLWLAVVACAWKLQNVRCSSIKILFHCMISLTDDCHWRPLGICAPVNPGSPHGTQIRGFHTHSVLLGPAVQDQNSLKAFNFPKVYCSVHGSPRPKLFESVYIFTTSLSHIFFIIKLYSVLTGNTTTPRWLTRSVRYIWYYAKSA